MANWEVTPRIKKSVEEHELWQKDDMVIRRITGFRTAKFIVTTDDDNPPVLEESNNHLDSCVDMFNCGYESEMEYMDDGWYSDVIWPDDMSEEEQDSLQELWDEDMYGAWEEEGWIQYETECWFFGDIEIKKIDN